jgi:hypothetical protein
VLFDSDGQRASSQPRIAASVFILGLTKITTFGDTFLLSRYNEIEFHGIMPDTGAARISTGGQPQFRALQRELPSLSLDAQLTSRLSILSGNRRRARYDEGRQSKPSASQPFATIEA